MTATVTLSLIGRLSLFLALSSASIVNLNQFDLFIFRIELRARLIRMRILDVNNKAIAVAFLY